MIKKLVAHGNSAALAAALIFLDINGITIVDYQSQLYKVMISLSTGRYSKAEFANTLKDLYI
jgi:prophage maintenance system killer protein